MPTETQVCDFTRSYVRWRVDTTILQPHTVSHKPPFTLNHVRVHADCLAEVTDRRTGKTIPYLLGASCKTEHVGVDRGVWTEPNSDFAMVAGPDRCMGIKRWDKTDKGVKLFPPTLGVQPERQVITPSESFTLYAADIRKTAGRLMTDNDDIARVLASEQHVVSRTRIEGKHYNLTLEYPAVTANYSTRERFYQLDTGPVIFPDLGADAEDVLRTFNLAFVAHIKRDWAEFLVCVPTPLTPQISVHHYSKSVRVDNCVNELFAI